MKSELDLVEEFCRLNEAKVEAWGSLPVASEQRWRELKGFYDNLLASRAATKVTRSDRFDLAEIRERLSARGRLRIPLDMSVFFCHSTSYAPGRSVNLSNGGIYLGSDVTLDPGEPLTIYMPNLGSGYELLFETTVDVVWTSPRRADSRGMGMRFRDLEEPAWEQLDEFIVHYIRDRLSKGTSISHRPGWIRDRWAVV